MVLTLTITDRAMIDDVLPKHAKSTADILLARAIRERVALTSEDKERCCWTEILIPEERRKQVTWKNSHDATFDFSEAEIGVMRGQIGEIEKDSRVTNENCDLIRKIKGEV